MTDLPPDDQPDEIWIGPIGPIPVHYADDPRLEAERAEWQRAAGIADALTTPDELLVGLTDDNWRVRLWVIDRVVARAGKDPQVISALIERLRIDPVWQVRDRAAVALVELPCDQRIIDALIAAGSDESEDVRESAAYALEQVERDQASGGQRS